MKQLEKLKTKGLYGSRKDPYWNKKRGRHDCCGAKRWWYHKEGCKACAG